MSIEASQDRTYVHSEFVYLEGSKLGSGSPVTGHGWGFGVPVPALRGSRDLSLGAEGGTARAEGRKAGSCWMG